MWFLVGLYIVAAIAANLSATWFGPSATIVNAFVLIGLDLTTRDKLHEAWQGKQLWWKMAALIATGSLLTYTVNSRAGPVALASFAAFAAAGIADTITFSVLGRYARLLRVNGSNVVSAAVDSFTFPTLAFGSLMPLIVLGQFAAKVGGGFLWSLVLYKLRTQREPVPESEFVFASEHEVPYP